MNLLKAFRKQKLLIVLILSAIILIESGLLFICCYVLGISVFDYIKKLFWTKDGFSWLSITAIATIVGVFSTIYTSSKSVHANIVSKERARWLVNHKKIMAEYISDINIIWKYGKIYYNRDKTKSYTEIIKKINDTLFSLDKNKHLLNLELYNSEGENKDFLEKINNLYDCALNLYSIVVKGKKSIQDKFKNNELGEVNESKIIDFSISVDKRFDYRHLKAYRNLETGMKSLQEEASKYYYHVWQQIKNQE